MKNKYVNFTLSFVLVVFLSAVFLFYILNILTSELELGSAYSFLGQVFMKSKEFKPQDFGHQIGNKINDPFYREEVMVAKPADFQGNGQNYVNLGPGIFLSPGSYRLTYDLAVSGIEEKEEFAVIDAFQVAGGVAAEKNLNSSDYLKSDFKPETFEFETDGGKGFEFRVLYLGKGELKVGRVKIESLNKKYGLLLKKSLLIFPKIKKYFSINTQ